jgi:tetratricopeptide (TPR) repeat protein
VTQQVQFRLGELLGGGARCEHLAPDEVMDLAEGRLRAGRLETLEQHARTCAACTELLDDVETFRKLTVSGVTIPAELRAFERSEARIRRRIGLSRLLSRFRWFLTWSVPAFAAMLLLVLWLAPEPARMIAEVERMPLVPPPSVRAAGAAETWREIALAWSADDMPRALSLLESAAAAGSEDASLWFYLGHARLLAGDARGAVDALARADALEIEAPSEHTRWMLAAALERTDRRNEACAALRSVAEIGGTRGAAARERVERWCGVLGQSAP